MAASVAQRSNRSQGGRLPVAFSDDQGDGWRHCRPVTPTTIPEVRKLQTQIADGKRRRAGRFRLPWRRQRRPLPEPPRSPPPPGSERLLTVPTSNPVLISQLRIGQKRKLPSTRKNRSVSIDRSLATGPNWKRFRFENNRLRNSCATTKSTRLTTASCWTSSCLRKQRPNWRSGKKAEKFSILDPAQPAQRPVEPESPDSSIWSGVWRACSSAILLADRPRIFRGDDHVCANQIPLENGNQVLEIIPNILTHRSV